MASINLTLEQLRKAILQLAEVDRRALLQQLDSAGSTQVAEETHSHSILDIPPVGLGAILQPLTADGDLLGEMLEGRP